MKTTWSTKSLISLIIACCATFALIGQDTVDVHLHPNAEATVVGQLESASLAVKAPWRNDTPAVKGWQPVFYRGTFEVYVNNSDIAKDLSPTPGSQYFLAPGRGTQVLSIATKEDKTEVISVDARYCHMSVETIIVGYIEYAAPTVLTPEPVSKEIVVPNELSESEEIIPAEITNDSEIIPAEITEDSETNNKAIIKAEIANKSGEEDQEIPSVELIEESEAPAAVLPLVEDVQVEAVNPARTLYGTLQKISSSKQRKFDSDYQLVDSTGKTLSYVNTQGLPPYIIIEKLLNKQVTVTGQLFEVEGTTTLRLMATAIKQAN